MPSRTDPSPSASGLPPRDSPAGRSRLPSGPDVERFLDRVEGEMYRDLHDAAPPEIARALGIESYLEGEALRLTVRAMDHPFLNRVMGFGTRPSDPGPALDDVARHYADAGIRRWMVQVLPHRESAALDDACATRGLVRHRGWAKHLGPASLDIPFRSDLAVEEVDPGDAAAVRSWGGLVVETFGLLPALADWYAALAGRPRWRLYRALDGARGVACGALYLAPRETGHPPLAQLNFAGTLPGYRNRGAQSALIARRIADARAAGAEWIVTETDEELPDRPNPSGHNMVRLGIPVVWVRANLGPPKPTG